MQLKPFFLSLPHKQAWLLAWPMIISNVSVPLMGLADTAMLGHLDSPQYLGAVAVGANVLSLFFWMFAFLRMGTTALTGQAYGAGDKFGISLQLIQGGTLALFFGFALIATQYLVLPVVLSLMTPDPALKELSLAYTQIRIYSAPAVFLTYVLIGWFVGLQNTIVPLIITVLSNLINLLLDYIFIVQLNWAHEGAALASLIAEYSALAVGIVAVLLRYRSSSWPRLKLRFYIKKFQPKKLLSLNADLFIRTTILLLVFNFVIAQSAAQGNVVLAVNAIMMQLLLFLSFALDGYAHAAESMVAHAIGEKNMTRFYSACTGTTLPAIAIAILISIGFIFFGPNIVFLMSDQHAVREQARIYLVWLNFLPIISIWCYMFDGIFIGSGKTRIMLYLMSISALFVFCPLWWLMRGAENHGLWAAFTSFNLSRSVLMALAFYYLSRRKRWLAN